MTKSTEYKHVEFLSFPISLQACPYLSAQDKIILQHIMVLSKMYARGCTLSNEELSNVHEVSKQTVSNVIAKATKLGWVVEREDNKRQINTDAWVHDRSIKVEVDEIWKTIGHIYCLAIYNTSHPLSAKAKEALQHIRELACGNDLEKEISDIKKFISGGVPDIKKFIHTLLLNKNNEIHEHSSSVIGVSVKRGSDNDVVSNEHVVELSQKRKALNMKDKETLDPLTIDIIEFWNSQPNLQKHRLTPVGRRTIRYPLAKQTATVRAINHLLIQITKNKFYSTRDEIKETEIRKQQFSLGQIKQAIKRFNLSGNSEFNDLAHKVRSTRLDLFFYNPHSVFRPTLTITSKYKYRAPFLHYLLNKPVKIENRQFESKTDYQVVVTRVIDELTANGSFSGTERDRNEVVRHVNVAVAKIKESANGSSSGIIKDLSTHIIGCMRSSGGVKFDMLFKTVNYKLVPYLRERRYL